MMRNAALLRRRPNPCHASSTSWAMQYVFLTHHDCADRLVSRRHEARQIPADVLEPDVHSYREPERSEILCVIGFIRPQLNLPKEPRERASPRESAELPGRVSLETCCCHARCSCSAFSSSTLSIASSLPSSMQQGTKCTPGAKQNAQAVQGRSRNGLASWCTWVSCSQLW